MLSGTAAKAAVEAFGRISCVAVYLTAARCPNVRAAGIVGSGFASVGMAIGLEQEG